MGGAQRRLDGQPPRSQEQTARVRYDHDVTVVEEIVLAVQELDEERQREVLALARRLREEPDVSIASVDFRDPSSVGEWRSRLQARAGQRVAEAMARFRALGLVDDEGRIVERDLPEDMRPGSKTSVAT